MTEEARHDLAPHGVLRAGINERNHVLVSARSLEAHLAQATLVRTGSAAEARELFAAHQDYLLAGLAS